MAKVNKKFEELTKTMDEVFLDREAYYEDLAYEMGQNEGIAKRNIEIAKKMLKDGLDINLISKYSSLSKEEIETLKK